MAKSVTKEIRLFFSWQSDLSKDATTNAIKESLVQACSDLESEDSTLKIFIEESTSNVPGSPDIPTIIFDKISTSDIHLADITTINPTAISIERKTANPNVLIELGFALSQLGWERVIMVFNTVFGEFPQGLPFDIDRKRIGKFAVKDKYDKSGKGSLKKLLYDALKEIIRHDPKKPFDKKKLSPEEKKRALDIIVLKRVMQTINIAVLDDFIERAPDYLHTKIVHFHLSFTSVIRSSHFHLYDLEALKLVKQLYKSWNESFSAEAYRDTSDPNLLKFGTNPGIPLTEKDKADYQKALKGVRKFRLTLKRLLNYLRNNYLEIDIEDLSRQAYEEYKDYYKDMTEKKNRK